jgi:hypothetical protein
MSGAYESLLEVYEIQSSMGGAYSVDGYESTGYDALSSYEEFGERDRRVATAPSTELRSSKSFSGDNNDVNVDTAVRSPRNDAPATTPTSAISSMSVVDTIRVRSTTQMRDWNAEYQVYGVALRITR